MSTVTTADCFVFNVENSMMLVGQACTGKSSPRLVFSKIIVRELTTGRKMNEKKAG
jgi:hypothetical protein